MVICSFVVESSTRETLSKRNKKNDPGRFCIMWLQQGASVNDQDFDSYAIFAEGARDSVMKSRLSQGDSSKAKMSTETLVIVGTLASLIGFIVQFTGLRSMHWSAPVAQLVATLVMAAVRAYVRRGMTERPHSRVWTKKGFSGTNSTLMARATREYS